VCSSDLVHDVEIDRGADLPSKGLDPI